MKHLYPKEEKKTFQEMLGQRYCSTLKDLQMLIWAVLDVAQHPIEYGKGRISPEEALGMLLLKEFWNPKTIGKWVNMGNGTFDHNPYTFEEAKDCLETLDITPNNSRWAHYMSKICYLKGEKSWWPERSAWPALPDSYLAKIHVEGKSPLEVAGAMFPGTAKDASQWLDSLNFAYRLQRVNDDIQNPVKWMFRGTPHIRDWIVTCRYPEVVAWIYKNRKKEFFKKPMDGGYYQEQRIWIQVLEHLDELEPRDLISNNPREVFMRCFSRKSEQALEELRRQKLPFRVPKLQPPEGCRWIRTSTELVDEGKRMSHCVGMYAEACRKGESYIMALPNSTVEFRKPNWDEDESQDLVVVQHQAENNTNPEPEEVKLVENWLKQIRKGAKKAA